MVCGAQGVFTRVAVEPGNSAHTFDASSEVYYYDVCTMRKRQKRVHQAENTGSRSLLATQQRQGPYLAGGELRMRMNPGYLDLWLPRILGGAESVNTFDVLDSLDTNGAFGVLVDKQYYTEEFKDCRVGRAMIVGKAAEPDAEEVDPVQMILQIWGQQHATGTSWPGSAAHGTGAQYVPYIFEEGVLTINSTARTIYGFRLLFDNRIVPRFANSLYPVALCPEGTRVVMFDVDFKFDSTNASGLFEYPDAGYASSTLVFTNSTVSTTFTLRNLEAVNEGPAINGQGELVYRLRFFAGKSGSDSEVTVTNDSTP